MKIAMANDHAGTRLKNELKAYLEAQGHEVVDFGTDNEESCDLSDFVYPASLAVAKGECDRGIFVDGVGYGSALIANKINGIYAAVCQDPFCAKLARQHTDMSLVDIGNRFNRRHSTVVKGITSIERHLSLRTPLGRELERTIESVHA